MQYEMLVALANGESIPPSAWLQLEAQVLADELRSQAFGINPTNVHQVLQARSHLLQSVYPDLLDFCQNHAIAQDASWFNIVWNLWLPLAIQLASDRQQLQRPLIQGILGGQGTGKTTLAAVLSLILPHLGYRTLGLSLDDLYKTYTERQALQQQDSRLIWRGPPGTHDITLGIAVLDQLRHNQATSIQIPRFDKSAWGGAGDRSQPDIVHNIDIVLFEGWFVGVRPIAPAAFENAPPPILTPSDRAFARDMNTQLQDYLPLWQRLDRLMVLYPTDYRLSLQWRRQAEHQLISSRKSGMNDEMVDQFVEYFWKSLHPELFIMPMIKNSDWVDLVIEIEPNRVPNLVYSLKNRLP